MWYCLPPALRVRQLALCQAICMGKETGRFLTCHSLKQRLVLKVSCFFLNCFSMDNCCRQACTDSIKVSLGNVPRGSALWNTQLLFVHTLGSTDLPASDLTFSFCAIDLRLFSSTTLRLAFSISSSYCILWALCITWCACKHPCAPWCSNGTKLTSLPLLRCT